MKAVVRILSQEFDSLVDFKNSDIWSVINDVQHHPDFTIEPIFSEKNNNIAIVVKSDNASNIYAGMLPNIQQKLRSDTVIVKDKFIIEDRHAYDLWIQYF